MNKTVGIQVGGCDLSDVDIAEIRDGMVKLLDTCAKHHLDQDTIKHVITQFATKIGSVNGAAISGCTISNL